jgi:hypothetical protein
VLKVDSRFLAREREWGDVQFSAKLIFFYNTETKLPPVFDSHIRYLQDLYPELFPKRSDGRRANLPIDIREFEQLACRIRDNPIKFLRAGELHFEYLLKESCAL